MNSLTPEERRNFRSVIQKIREERKAATGKGVSAREVLESQGKEFPSQVRRALEGVAARDEMGPKVGQEPPDFFLKRMGSEERVRLSSFKGKRPVALVFGSYT
jgi:signal recognition particle GTPase